MRRLVVVAMAGLAACSLPASASRDSLTYRSGDLIPLGVLHADPRLDSVSVRGASDELALMNEPRLDPGQTEEDVFRLLYRPAFHAAIAIRVVDSGSSCTIIRKEAVQRPPKEIGKEVEGIIPLALQPDSLVRADSLRASAAECQAIRAAVDSLRLGVEPHFSAGPDGETFLFESSRAGRYSAREVWSPDSARAPHYVSAAGVFLRWAPTARR